MLKKNLIKIALILGIFGMTFTAFPHASEAAKVEQVPDYYFAQKSRSTGRFSQDYGHTYKYLSFVNGYTRGGPVTSTYSSNLLNITYKYTYTYYKF